MLHRKMQSHDAALSERDLRAMRCMYVSAGRERSELQGEGGRVVDSLWDTSGDATSDLEGSRTLLHRRLKEFE